MELLPPPYPDEPVLTAVAVLTCWRREAFNADLARLRQVGHVIEVETGPGFFERKYTVTAKLTALNLLLGNRVWP